MIILAFLSAFGGLLNLPVIHTFGNWLEHTIKIEEAVKEVTLGAEAAKAATGFDPIVAGTATLLALIAIALAWYIYDRRYKEALALPRGKRSDDPLRPMLGPVFRLLENKYWVDELYGNIIIKPYGWLSRFLADQVDWRFWHDWFHDRVIVGGYNLLTRLLAVRFDLGGIDAFFNGLATLVQRFSALLRQVQTGYVRNYALMIFVGVVVILGYLLLR